MKATLAKRIGAVLAAQLLLSSCGEPQSLAVATTPPLAAAQPTATERVVVVTATPMPPTPTERVIVIVVTATAPPTTRATRRPTLTPAPLGDLAIDLDNAPGGANVDDLKVTIMASRFNKNGTSFIGFRVLARRKGRSKDGDGIRSVNFSIVDEDEHTQVYAHTERNAPFCAFQESSGTTCRVLSAKKGDVWRASDAANEVTQVPFRDGTFSLQVNVNGENGEGWFATSTFKIKTTNR